jgi:hypothetical protein
MLIKSTEGLGGQLPTTARPLLVGRVVEEAVETILAH